MVNPGAFRGSRKEFLTGEKPAYSTAMAGGYAADCLALIQRRYFKRYPIELPHFEEPSPEHLAAVDDNSPEPEIEEPDPDKLTEEEYAAAVAKIDQRRAEVHFRKAQIKRWMAYQFMKDNDLDPKESGANNPYRALLHKLTGQEIARPRRKTPVNVWRKTKRSAIEERVKARAASTGASRDKLATMRDKVAREMFCLLSEAEKKHWEQQAIVESDAAAEAWKREMESGPSTAPADRQRCIQGLVQYAQPILDGIAEATGWRVTMMAGGPEPAFDGKLNIISVHSGVITGDVKMNFGRAERERYKKQVVPIFGSFLQKCFSPEECRARALAPDEGFFPMEAADLEADGATIHSVECYEPLPVSSSASSTTLVNETEPEVSPPSRGPSPQLSPPPSRGPTPPLSPARSPPLSPARSHNGSPPPVGCVVAVPGTTAQPEVPVQPVVVAPTSPVQPAERGVISPSSQPVVVASTPPQQPDIIAPAPSPPLSTPPLNNVLSKQTDSASSAMKEAEVLIPGKGKRGRKRGVVASGTNGEENHNAPKSKRVRTARQGAPSLPTTSSTAASPSPPATTDLAIATPPDAPKWFESALEMLQDDQLGAPWATLLKGWVAFEVQEDFTEVEKLKSTHRPIFIKDWIQRRRSSSWRPSAIKLAECEEAFMTWWTSLQPDWRLSDEEEIVFTAVEGDWSDLRRPGLNGLFSVLAALFYWGLAVQEQKAVASKWLLAVEDCRAAFTHLLVSV